MRTKLIITLFFTLVVIAAHAQTSSGRSYQLNSHIMQNKESQIAHEFLLAVQQGNNEKLGALLHPDVQWKQPGNNRFSGIKKSAAEVFEMVGGMFEMSASTLKLTDIKVISVNGNSVACLVHWNAAQPAGAVLDVDNIDVYTVENDKIVSATVYTADAAQEDKFWGK